MKIKFLFAETFRAGQQYMLVEANQMYQSGQDALIDIFNDEDIFGLFIPEVQNENSTYKVAYKDIALLFYFFQSEGKLPHYIRRNFDDEINRILAKLVLDGILEIKWQDEFLTGVNAQVALYEFKDSNDSTNSHIINISEKAINYGLSLQDIDTRSLSTKIYCYNTLPVSENSYTYLNDSFAIEKYLEIDNLYQRKMLKGWTKSAPSDEFSWISWFYDATKNKINNKERSTYKIYISPTIESMPKVFLKFLEVLPQTKAFSFKVGSELQGLLRPDKWVVYFHDKADLLEASELFIPAFANFPVQGVPFTAPIDSKGILSWGIDPPRKEVLQNIEGGSWRANLTDKIAIAIGQAKDAKIEGAEAYNFVMNKLFLENIDASTWTPIQIN
jgi:hypothetical protein